MNSADAWHDSNADPDNLEALLGMSVELAQIGNAMHAEMESAKQRHPSAQPALDALAPTLTAADRCDAACSAAALYRVARFDVAGRPFRQALDFCRHHFFEHFPGMVDRGWKAIGANVDLFAELESTSRSKGTDHA